MAGRRGRDRGGGEEPGHEAAAGADCTALAGGGGSAGVTGDKPTAHGHDMEEEGLQQVLQDTQLEVMDVEDAGAAAGTLETASTTEEARDGSFGEGKVQSSLQGWLKYLIPGGSGL